MPYIGSYGYGLYCWVSFVFVSFPTDFLNSGDNFLQLWKATELRKRTTHIFFIWRLHGSYHPCHHATVDDSQIWRSPDDMVNIQLFTGFYTSQVVVWDFFHPQYHPSFTSLALDKQFSDVESGTVNDLVWICLK